MLNALDDFGVWRHLLNLPLGIEHVDRIAALYVVALSWGLVSSFAGQQWGAEGWSRVSYFRLRSIGLISNFSRSPRGWTGVRALRRCRSQRVLSDVFHEVQRRAFAAAGRQPEASSADVNPYNTSVRFGGLDSHYQDHLQQCWILAFQLFVDINTRVTVARPS